MLIHCWSFHFIIPRDSGSVKVYSRLFLYLSSFEPDVNYTLECLQSVTVATKSEQPIVLFSFFFFFQRIWPSSTEFNYEQTKRIKKRK